MDRRFARSLRLLAALAALLFSGCTSLAELIGGGLNGERGSKAIYGFHDALGSGINFYRVMAKDNAQALLITWDKLPQLRIYGSAPGPDGRFYLEKGRLLASSVSGWNEFEFEAAGGGVWKTATGTAYLALDGPVEKLRISGGQIKRGETRLSGAEALTALNNRQERIGALAAWMKERGAPAFAGQKDFEAYWKPVLLPEMVARRDRGPEFSAAGDYVRAEDVNWNTAWTESLFPEDLRPLRESGSLLRDWEEAVTWMFFEYEWDNFVGLLQGKLDLIRRRTG
jgi:hypothetical protein